MSDAAWLEAMLKVEQALGRARGVELDEAAFDPLLYDVRLLAEEGRAEANPVVPLVRALRERAGTEVHRGATSQDVLDTAAMLVARNALALVRQELSGAAAECARLAATHRSTPAAARTLLQQAVPTTFGYRAALWLAGLLDAGDRLVALRLPAQLGGAAGTLAAFGGDGLAVAARFAAELELRVPTLPWHTNRTRIAGLGAALGIRRPGASARSGSTSSSSPKPRWERCSRAMAPRGARRRCRTSGTPRARCSRVPARGWCTRTPRCSRPVTTSRSARRVPGRRSGRRSRRRSRSPAGRPPQPATAWPASMVHVERMRANMSDDLYSEARAFGFEGEYLGAAEELVDRILARYEGRLR